MPKQKPQPVISLVNVSRPEAVTNDNPPRLGDSLRLVVTGMPNGNHDVVLAVYAGDWEHEFAGGPGLVDQWGKSDDDDEGDEWAADFVMGTPEHGENPGGAWLEQGVANAYVLQGSDFAKPPLAFFGIPVLP